MSDPSALPPTTRSGKSRTTSPTRPNTRSQSTSGAESSTSFQGVSDIQYPNLNPIRESQEGGSHNQEKNTYGQERNTRHQEKTAERPRSDGILERFYDLSNNPNQVQATDDNPEDEGIDTQEIRNEVDKKYKAKYQKELKEFEDLKRAFTIMTTVGLPKVEPSKPTPNSASHAKEVKPINVSIFDGDSDQLGRFFTDLRVLFRQRSSTYHDNDVA